MEVSVSKIVHFIIDIRGKKFIDVHILEGEYIEMGKNSLRTIIYIFYFYKVII